MQAKEIFYQLESIAKAMDMDATNIVVTVKSFVPDKENYWVDYDSTQGKFTLSKTTVDELILDFVFNLIDIKND